MKQKISDMMISYLLKGGIIMETRGDFETEVEIPVKNGEVEKTITVSIRCRDLSVRTIKERENPA